MFYEMNSEATFFFGGGVMAGLPMSALSGSWDSCGRRKGFAGLEARTHRRHSVQGV